MGTLLQDLRYATRSLLRAPGFTLIAVVTLALGIGANTAIFSVLYGVLLRPLPYPEPDRLIGMQESYRGESGEMAVTYSEFRYVEEHATIFESYAASTSVGMNLYTGTEAERVDALRVSKNYFRVLGVAPALGRTFNDEEDQPAGADAVILSHGIWQRRFGADAGVIGRTVTLNGRPFSVVGVMPSGFQSPGDPQVWSTLSQVAQSVGSGQNLESIGRLKPGMSVVDARAAMEGTLASFRIEFARMLSKDVVIGIAPYRELSIQDLKGPVRILFGAIGFVLLIACANVANLVLGRTASRGRELAVRVAIGATRRRIMAQLVTESVVLALIGGTLGLAFASVGLDALLRFVPSSLSSSADIRLDGWAMLFAFVVSLLTGVLFGAVPAWQVASTDLHGTLKESTRTTGGVSQGRLRNALVVAEVALSLILLVGAGLLIETFTRLVRTDSGFDTRHVASAQIWLSGPRFDSTAKITAYYRQVTNRIAALPGVEAAAVVEAGLPLQRGGNMGTVVDDGEPHSTDYRTVTPDYFRTLGIAVKRGRVFTDADVGGGPPVVVVSESFAHRYLAGDAALGHRVRIGGTGGVTGEVVGVVGDVKSFIGSPPRPTVFLASAQTPPGFTRIFAGWFPIHVMVRTVGDPSSVLQLLDRSIREINAEVPVGQVRTMSDVLSTSLAFQRFVMLLLTVFAALAIVLASVGIYGVISYLVAQRTHEIGVRMALGARQSDVLRMVLGRGLLLAVIGSAVGLAGAVALTRLLGDLLYNVKPIDVPIFAVVTLVLVSVALAACFVPARRAAKTDPMVALRTD